MAEPTLSITYTTLRQQVGFELGLGTTIAKWSADESAMIDFCIAGGLRQFYSPPPIPSLPGRPPHRWSFLRPVTTIVAWGPLTVSSGITLSTSGASKTIGASAAAFYPSMVGASITITGSGTYTVTAYHSETSIDIDTTVTLAGATFSMTPDGNLAIPDEFAALEGVLVVVASDAAYFRVRNTSESVIRQSRQSWTATGRPTDAAVVPIRPTAATSSTGTGQRWQLQLFPIQDTTYTLRYRFMVLPDQLGATNFYAYGGALHGEAILASCLDIACRRVKNDASRTPEFFRALEASIGLDNANAPESLGFSQDEPGLYDERSRPASVFYNGSPL